MPKWFARFIVTLCLVICLLTGPTAVAYTAGSAADSTADRAVDQTVAQAVDGAVDRAVGYLLSKQLPDGSIGGELYARHPAVAGLVGLALLADGSTPQSGKHREPCDRLLGYLLASAQMDGKKTGLIGAADATNLQPMYGHGFALAFLAECLGMSDRPDLREKVERGVELIVRTQNEQGGWRYEAEIILEADISVTATQLTALRAAKNASLYVPNETIDRAADYIRKCHNADGGFRYRHILKESAFARSAAALVALQAIGLYGGSKDEARGDARNGERAVREFDEIIEKGYAYLQRFAPDAPALADGSGREPEYYVYGHYYAAQAIWCAGENSPLDFNRWYASIASALLKRQATDGSWKSSISTEAETAMVVILLRLPKGLVPGLQR